MISWGEWPRQQSVGLAFGGVLTGWRNNVTETS